MSALIRIRSARGAMSAIERRIADFILANAALLRDYSSQQLANALQVSQSSVVKFSQKLGFKGYPDLKFAIGTAVARGDEEAPRAQVEDAPAHPITALADDLRRRKDAAEEETRAINAAETVDAVAECLRRADRVLLAGFGPDGDVARELAHRLAHFGRHAVFHADTALLEVALAAGAPGDALVVISEHGREPAWAALLRRAREHRQTVVTMTRNSANPLRAQAHHALLVSAHDDQPFLQALLHRHVQQQLLDLISTLIQRRDAAAAAFFDACADRREAAGDD